MSTEEMIRQAIYQMEQIVQRNEMDNRPYGVHVSVPTIDQIAQSLPAHINNLYQVLNTII